MAARERDVTEATWAYHRYRWGLLAKRSLFLIHPALFAGCVNRLLRSLLWAVAVVSGHDAAGHFTICHNQVHGWLLVMCMTNGCEG